MENILLRVSVQISIRSLSFAHRRSLSPPLQTSTMADAEYVLVTEVWEHPSQSGSYFVKNEGSVKEFMAGGRVVHFFR